MQTPKLGFPLTESGFVESAADEYPSLPRLRGATTPNLGLKLALD